MNIIKAIPINPVIINVIPNPLRGAGTFEYLIFSLIAAIPTIASNQPTPEPRPKEVACASDSYSLSCIKRELFYVDEFKDIEKQFDNFSLNIALSEPLPEDNWKGYTGFIHQVVLDEYLRKHPEPEDIEFYLCGPPLMNDAVLKMLDDYGVPEEMIAFDDFGG